MNTPSYNIIAYAALGAWVPIVLGLFAVMKPRRAVIAAFVGGYLFLPELTLHFHTLPDISKVSLTAVGVVLGSLTFDSLRLLTVRPRWIDLACLVLCFSPIVTSIENGLGFMDGMNSALIVVTKWGLAYWIGRAYFTDWESARELAIGIILGGVAYIPFCWWEIRMSPQLHGQIYGYTFESFRRDSGLFGFRPNVFLADGLTVTMFMGVASLLAFWAWMTRSPRTLLGVPMFLIAAALIGTTVFCKAMGGLVLLVAGMGVLTLTRFPRTRLAVLFLIVAAPIYMMVRATGQDSGDRLVEMARQVSETRAQSLAFRLRNENLLAAKALQQPWFGWGGWDRSHVFDPDSGRDLTIVDGLWIIMLGEHGLVGLAALTLMVLGSATLLWWRIPTRFWTDPACAAPVALSVVVILYMIDSLFNATFNPVASLAVGAVASMSYTARATFSARAAVRVPAGPARQVVSSIKDIPYVYSPVRP